MVRVLNNIHKVVCYKVHELAMTLRVSAQGVIDIILLYGKTAVAVH